MISPVALLLTATVLLNCPTIIGQVLQPIQSPKKRQRIPPPIETGPQTRPTTTNQQEASAPYKISSRFHVQKGTQTGYLIVKVELPKGSYIHSTTQKAPLRPSKIAVAESKQFRINGKFAPDQLPTVIEKDPVFEQRLEKHMDVVQFFAIVQIAPDANIGIKTLELNIFISDRLQHVAHHVRAGHGKWPGATVDRVCFLVGYHRHDISNAQFCIV